MEFPRCYVETVELNGQLVAVGGHDGHNRSHLNSLFSVVKKKTILSQLYCFEIVDDIDHIGFLVKLSLIYHRVKGG
jgi:hypothetical protein